MKIVIDIPDNEYELLQQGTTIGSGIDADSCLRTYILNGTVLPTDISKSSKSLIRYRFRTKSVEDFRPLIDLATIKMPYWCTGYGLDGDFETANAIIVCYLPKTEDLFKYWDDAYDIEKEECDEIIYTDRFPKPDWCN